MKEGMSCPVVEYNAHIVTSCVASLLHASRLESAQHMPDARPCLYSNRSA